MFRTLRWYTRLYFLIGAQYIKARMQYRADFIISSIGMLFTNIVSIGVFWVLFHSISSLNGWNYNEILFMYGFYLLSVSVAQIFFDHIWQLRFHIIEGTFIKYYFRPLNMMFYYMSEMIDIKGFTQVAIGIFTLAYASAQLNLTWTFPRILLLLFSLSGASLVVTSILIIASCTTFWVYGSYPILELAFKLRAYSQYPITIFDGFFRFLFTYIIPIGFVAFYPSQLFLRPDEASWIVYMSPLVGIGAFALAYAVWTWGVNSYTGTGS
jgi:ABC-2 type transport system permease protein